MIFLALCGSCRADATRPPPSFDDLEHFLHQSLVAHLQKFNVPGCAFVFVRDGKIRLAWSYGFRDLERRLPVSAETTLFPVASISKTITAEAVLQMVEHGRLRLDEDVEHYLTRVHLHRNYPRPVTLADLLTHMAGFDSTRTGTFARTQEDVLPLEQAVVRLMPPQVRPPGSVLMYSDYDYTLAGYIVESVAGVPFARYVERNVLDPLGMRRSGFALRPDWQGDVATLYLQHSGKSEPIPSFHPQEWPGVAFAATATDMGRFIIAQLPGSENHKVLSASAVRQMHARRFGPSPDLPGVTYGFFEDIMNGERVVYHSGARFSGIVLLPERGIGFFIAFNGIQSYAMTDFLKEFLARYFPPPAATEPPGMPLLDGRPFNGYYRAASIPVSNFEKIGFLKYPDVEVRALPNGKLNVGKPLDAEYVRVGPLLFAPANPALGNPRIAFREEDGEIRDVCFLGETYERIPWYRTRIAYVASAGACVLAFCVCLLVIAWRVVRRWQAMAPGRVRRAEKLSAAACFLNLAFLFGLSRAVAAGPYNLYFACGIPAYFRALLWVPVATGLLAAGGIWTLAMEVRSKRRVAVCAWAGCIACLLFTWMMNDWNLLGFRY